MRIDVTLVRELIASQFPDWVGLPIRPVERGGWDNRTFRLGEDMTVRLPSAAAYVAQVDKEQHWLPVLAPQLPLAIPTPVVQGMPGCDYPWPWSIYRWIDGENAADVAIDDVEGMAVALAQFLRALQRIDATGGPAPGPHNFHRGGALTVYDAETRDAIAALAGIVDTPAVTAVWEAALDSAWRGRPVWLHGDVSAANLLVNAGRLHAVIDFGCSGVGDPACDLTIAWTMFSRQSRDAFRAAVALDAETWARARGWAIWKALITLARSLGNDPAHAHELRRVIAELVVEHRRRP